MIFVLVQLLQHDTVISDAFSNIPVLAPVVYEAFDVPEVGRQITETLKISGTVDPQEQDQDALQ